MFGKKVQYDCVYEALATATIRTADCSHWLDLPLIGVGENFQSYRVPGSLTDNEIIDYYKFAVDDWSASVTSPLNTDVIYNDKSIAPFANMIHNKTMKFGCWHLQCSDAKKLSIACVYDNLPKEGEPLYSADSTGKKGCTTDSPCKKVVKGAVCSTDSEGNKGPLCEIAPASTAAPSSSTEPSVEA
ncbi:unnamed protein product [Strongylus vulgaris]|uniref:SCP domain-containing protein n=1 Tax=Strongylus vulgaris TaxID=40348 RepID=A0A3P7J3Q3_STRVU|nr:unnamed protein product [Strongylus vulgaris]